MICAVCMYVCMNVSAPSSMMTSETSDITAAAIPVPSREGDRVPDASRRLTATE